MKYAHPPRLLVVSPDVVGKKMAGPGMRYVEITRALAPYMPTTFAVGIDGSTSTDLGRDVTVRNYSHVDELKKLIDDCDVIFCQMIDRNAVLYALQQGKRIVYDFYNALPVETIGAERISGYTNAADKDSEFSELLNYFAFCAQTGNFFVCSNPHQRDYWLGFIMASRGLLPSTLEARQLDQIIGYTPFGMEAGEPKQEYHALRGTPGIPEDAFILLWAGGIWDWFDAMTPIRAVAELSKIHPKIKLVFYGTTHPNSAVGQPKNVVRAIKLSKELGVYGKSVFFLEGWVPVNERVNYLLDANLGIYSHVASLETSFAFRTRILDHFWAKLPSIVTGGDWFAEYVVEQGLGTVTPPQDITATKQAIEQFYSDKMLRSKTVKNINAIRKDWRWTETTRSLRNYLLLEIMDSPVRPVPIVANLVPITLTQVVRSSKHVQRLHRTPIWPIVRRVRRLLRP